MGSECHADAAEAVGIAVAAYAPVLHYADYPRAAPSSSLPRVPDSASSNTQDIELRSHVERTLSNAYEVDQEL